MKRKLIHQSFNLCFFQSTKTLKTTNKSFDGKTTKSSHTVEVLEITLNKNINFEI